MERSLEGLRVQRICLDHAASLYFDDGTELRIEAPYRVSSLAGERLIDPSDRVGSVDPVVALMDERVLGAAVGDTGVLSLHFSGGSTLTSEPDPEFEAWVLTSATGQLLVCMPGGSIARWEVDE